MIEVRTRVVAAAAFAMLVLAALAPTADAGRRQGERPIAYRADGIAVDERGNRFVAASTEGTVEGPSVALSAGYGRAGRRLWTRRWEPARAWSGGVDVALGPDGSVFVAGSVGREHYEGGAWFLEHRSATGRLLWRRAAPGWHHLLATGVTSVAVGAGMVVIGGHEYGCCSVAADEGWVRAYSLDGDLLWVTDVAAPGRFSANHDGVADVAVGGKGSVYLTGWVETKARSDDTEATDVEVLIQKLSEDGALIWSRVLLDHHRRDLDRGVSVATRGDELVVAAYLTGGWLAPGRTDRAGHAWLGRFTFDGRLRWSRAWGNDRRLATEPTSTALAEDGTIVVVGAARDPTDEGIDAFVRSWSPSGRPGWSTTLGVDSRLWATDVDLAGRFLAVSGYRIGEGRSGRIRGGRTWLLRLPGP